MNKEQQKEFNLKCAEFMGIHIDRVGEVWVHYTDFDSIGEVGRCFNPYNDANDRNKVIEKMKITTSSSLVVREWRCLHESCDVWNESMEAAQIACISAVLGVDNE